MTAGSNQVRGVSLLYLVHAVRVVGVLGGRRTGGGGAKDMKPVPSLSPDVWQMHLCGACRLTGALSLLAPAQPVLPQVVCLPVFLRSDPPSPPRCAPHRSGVRGGGCRVPQHGGRHCQGGRGGAQGGGRAGGFVWRNDCSVWTVQCQPCLSSALPPIPITSSSLLLGEAGRGACPRVDAASLPPAPALPPPSS